MNLRPYQQQLITDIRLQYQQGHRQVLAVLPTGGGKTVCFSYIAQSVAKKGNRVCILVHRQELLDQASRSLAAMGVRQGGDRCRPLHEPGRAGAGGQRPDLGEKAASPAAGVLPAGGG